MKFNLEELNPGVFFPFDDDGEGGVTIRLANGDLLAKIDKKCVKKRVEYRRGARHEFIEENDELRSELLWDYVITGWKGVYNQEDNEIPCTKDNKTKLMRGSVKFSSFIGNCVEELTSESEMHTEELEKN